MAKTIAEARPSSRPSSRASRPPMAWTSPSASRWPGRRRGSAWRSTRRTCTRRRRAPSPARSSPPPMLAELDVHGVVLGHSDGTARENRPGVSEKVPAALDAGLEPDPVRGRDRGRGDTERKLRHGAGGTREARQPAPGRCRHRLSTPSGPSEPGSWRRPSRPRTRSPSCARWWPIATATGRSGGAGSSTGARSSPTTRPSCSALPNVLGASVGGLLDVADFTAIVEAARGKFRRSVSSSSTAENLTVRATPCRWRRRVLDGRRVPAQPAANEWGTAVGLPERQMGKPRWGLLDLGAGAAVKQDLTRIGEAVRGRDPRPQRRPAGRGAGRPVHLIGLGRGGVHSAGAISTRSSRSRSMPTTSSCTRSPTGATPCRTRAPASSSASSTGARTPAVRLGCRPLLGDGPRQALGAHPRRPTTCSFTAAPSTRRQRRRGRARRVQAR